MTANITNLISSYLNETNKLKDLNQFLESILQNLEEKNDPSAKEIQMVSDIYQFLEKFNLLKENMQNYSHDLYNRNSYGNKLFELMEDKDKYDVEY